MISLSELFIIKHFECKGMIDLDFFFNMLVHSANCTACNRTLFRHFLGFESCYTSIVWCSRAWKTVLLLHLPAPTPKHTSTFPEEAFFVAFVVCCCDPRTWGTRRSQSLVGQHWKQRVSNVFLGYILKYFLIIFKEDYLKEQLHYIYFHIS